MYLKAAKLAEAMQLAATPAQPSVRSASPEAVSHGKLSLQCRKLHLQPPTPAPPTPLHHLLHHLLHQPSCVSPPGSMPCIKACINPPE